MPDMLSRWNSDEWPCVFLLAMFNIPMMPATAFWAVAGSVLPWLDQHADTAAIEHRNGALSVIVVMKALLETKSHKILSPTAFYKAAFLLVRLWAEPAEFDQWTCDGINLAASRMRVYLAWAHDTNTVQVRQRPIPHLASPDSATIVIAGCKENLLRVQIATIATDSLDFYINQAVVAPARRHWNYAVVACERANAAIAPVGWSGGSCHQPLRLNYEALACVCRDMEKNTTTTGALLLEVHEELVDDIVHKSYAM